MEPLNGKRLSEAMEHIFATEQNEGANILVTERSEGASYALKPY